jgi:hypothetical protein
MTDLGRTLIVAGACLVVAGLLLTFHGKIPWLGHLPGDLSVERENFRLYIPFTTSIILSVVVSLLLYLFRR